MRILVAICLRRNDCVHGDPPGPPPSAPLPKPAVYEWVGPGLPPSLQRLAHDKEACFHEAEQRNPCVSARWQTHMKRCMERRAGVRKPSTRRHPFGPRYQRATMGRLDRLTGPRS